MGWANRPVADAEILSRYLLSSGHFVRSGRVKPRAFEPKFDEERGRLETSVFRTTDLSEIDGWALAQREIGVPRRMPILARAELLTSAARHEELVVDSDEPPKRHAIMIAWPAEKDKQIAIQQALASKARLHLAPPAAQ